MVKSIISQIRIALALIIILVIVILLITSQWFWKFIYPMPYKNIVWEHATTIGVDPYLVMALIRTESNFIPRAISRSGALGLMQLMPKTAEYIAEKNNITIEKTDDLYDPSLNIQLGTLYIKYLMKKCNNNVTLVIAAYNGGIGNVEDWLRKGVWDGTRGSAMNIPFEETRKYVGKVLRSYEVYVQLYSE